MTRVCRAVFQRTILGEGYRLSRLFPESLSPYLRSERVRMIHVQADSIATDLLLINTARDLYRLNARRKQALKDRPGQ